MKEQSTILPIIYPPLTTFQGYACPLAILCCYNDALDWVYMHYIQIFCVEKYFKDSNSFETLDCFFVDSDTGKYGNGWHSLCLFNGDFCPHLKSSILHSELFKNKEKEFIDLIKKYIDLGMYIYVMVDVFKISSYRVQNNKNHEIFIYGYDDKERKFYYADFLNNRSGKFDFSTCSYENFKDAYYSHVNRFHYTDGLVLIKYDYKESYKFQEKYVFKEIFEYLHPPKIKVELFNEYFNKRYSIDTRIYMGIDVYTYLQNKLESEIQNNTQYIDVRLYHAMLDHKEMMIKRIEYFIKKGYINKDKQVWFKDYVAVRNSMLITRNAIVKANVNGNFKRLSVFKDKLEQTKNLEKKLLTNIFIGD